MKKETWKNAENILTMIFRSLLLSCSDSVTGKGVAQDINMQTEHAPAFLCSKKLDWCSCQNVECYSFS